MNTWTSGRYTVRVGGAPLSPAVPPTTPTEAARWRAEGDRLRLAGDVRGADAAYARQLRASVSDPRLIQAAEALVAGRPDIAEQRLGAVALDQTNALALWLRADIVSRLGRNGEAEGLLTQCLTLAPDFTDARYAYAMVLNWRHKAAATLAQAEILVQAAPDNGLYWHLKATSHLQLGDDAQAVAAYEAVLRLRPDLPLTWMSYGHALKTIGRQADAVAAYRRSLALSPILGEAWWSLANLKTVRFTEADVAQMQAALAASDLSPPDRLQLQFALGKAHEDAGQYETAFGHYAAGNALQRARLAYDADANTAQIQRTKALLGAAFFAARAAQGLSRPDPIFIVGLPRSGSTLVEQILASHSQVEGTQELSHLPALAARLAGPARREAEGAYPDILAALAPSELAALGEEYLTLAAAHRKLDRPFFIDKLPNNYVHTGFIRLILPQARIIDARRHPLGCCFSGYKQHFAAGQAFSYDLGDIGRYYRDYVELMAHFDAALPGFVHRVIYEQLVADPEAEVRRLLDYCGLAFEPGCLKFYENDRAVRTASSEQVRRPIFTDAADHWRRFEPWLDPLKAALGPVLDAYPGAPEF